jgi:hypothetical protein
MLQQARGKNSYLSLIIIVGTLAVLFLILAVVVVVFFTTRQASSDQASRADLLVGLNPLTQLEADQVDPALALASLGGAPEAEVIAEAIDKARPETALSALLFQPALSSKESAGGFLQLAAAYTEQGDRQKAIFSAQMAGLIATLAPDIPDTVRADLLLQGGEGLIAVQEPMLAKFYLDQAFVVASKSPFLQAPHRRAIFERLQKNYISLEERALARQSLSLSANPPTFSAVAERQTILPGPQPIPLSASIQEAEAARWRAAQELAVLLVERGGRAPQPFVEALSQTLVAEDQLRLPFYESEFDKTTQLSQKIDITFAQINWLSTKYKVARRAYGLSIVPEWEAQAEQIRADLTKSYETLFALYADLVIALPEVSQIDRATEERLRSEILAGELGRYPNYPEEQRQQQLLEAIRQLQTTQPELKVFVTITEVNDDEIFTLTALEE